MRSHRFYIPASLVVNTSVALSADVAHHCAQVLRYNVGDPLVLFNGDSFDYSAVITGIEKKRCVVEICRKYDPKNESPLKIHLMQGIARGDKMDFIIQKVVELGVAEITPVFTERCNVKLDKKRLNKKMAHWNKTIISASEQSGRAVLTRLNDPVTIENIPKLEHCSIFLEPTVSESFGELDIEKNVRIIIGPEGGFTQSDLTLLARVGFKGSKIGPRILRTETAGLSAISILQSRFGDLAH